MNQLRGRTGHKFSSRDFQAMKILGLCLFSVVCGFPVAVCQPSSATTPPVSRATIGTAGPAVSVSALVPAGWNPKAEADKAMAGMIQVTGPEVKGAHDSDLVRVCRRAR